MLKKLSHHRTLCEHHQQQQQQHTAATRNCLTHFELRSIEIYVNFSVCVRVRVCEAVTLWVFFRTRLSLCHIWNYARFFSAVFFPSPFLRKEKILLPYFRICFMFMMQTKGSKQTKKETQCKRRDRGTERETVKKCIKL